MISFEWIGVIANGESRIFPSIRRKHKAARREAQRKKRDERGKKGRG